MKTTLLGVIALVLSNTVFAQQAQQQTMKQAKTATSVPLQLPAGTPISAPSTAIRRNGPPPATGTAHNNIQEPGSATSTKAESATTKYTPAPAVPNDPFNAKIYTLKNGLKVYLSVNKEAPRIQTFIAVRAGSKFDPPQTTGLAHYLEHMMFKGSHDFGTKDWAKEKVLLDSISLYFEYHKNEKDEAKKKALYAKIDSFSYEASKLAIPNEFDKMVSSLGAKGTNAFTSTDMTVYVNDIPSNALDKFMDLQANRFQTAVLRLFHTELETVYEEFNRNQDNDRRWSDHNIDNALLPNHPYGTQTTIGEGEHLKNPSMVNIYNYFNTYYRPNNVAIILSGDLDPDKTMAIIEKYFGNWKPGMLPAFEKKPEPEVTAPITREYKGPQPEHVYVGYLFNGANTHDAMMAKLVDAILTNGSAGIVDLDLVQQQKLLTANTFIDENTDYCFHKLYGEPKQGQTLEEVKDLLLGEVEKVKKGEFGDWLLPAIVKSFKLERMRTAEKNQGRVSVMMGTFVHDIPWSQWVNEIDEMEKVTKADVVKFANEHYKNNYAISYKRQGEATVHKVEKPKITAVVMNKEDISAFKKEWDKLPQTSVTPKFLDFNKDITHLKLAKGDVPFEYIKNDINKTFQLDYIFDMGTDNIRDIGLAVNYLKYLGTDKYTAEQLKIEFFKLGLDFSVNTGRDRVYVSLSGLEENLEKGVELFEHILSNVKPDKEVYASLIDDIKQSRANAKKNKNAILQSGLANYAKYGALNPFNNVMSEEELKSEDINKLVILIKSLNSYKHHIFYYGNRDAQSALAAVNKLHTVKEPLKDYPTAKKYPELPLGQSNVLVCYYPMKQAEIVLLGKDTTFDKSLFPSVYMYNDYYGSGLSSIMFQEIREKMALAYSVYSSFGVPQYSYESHYLVSYVGTQADKLKTALAEMNKLLNDMPEVPQQYEDSRDNVVKTISTDWTTGADIYWAYDRAKKRGLDYDVRKDIYEKVKTMKLSDTHQFFNQHIKGKKLTYLVIGKKEDLNMDALKELGPVTELSTEQLFGY